MEEYNSMDQLNSRFLGGFFEVVSESHIHNLLDSEIGCSNKSIDVSRQDTSPMVSSYATSTDY